MAASGGGAMVTPSPSPWLSRDGAHSRLVNTGFSGCQLASWRASLPVTEVPTYTTPSMLSRQSESVRRTFHSPRISANRMHPDYFIDLY